MWNMENKRQDLAPAPGSREPVQAGAECTMDHLFPSVFIPRLDQLGWRKIERDGAPAPQPCMRGTGTGEVQNWNSPLQRQVEWRQFTRNQEKWQILQNTECCIHFRQLFYPSSGWYRVFYKSQAASQRWGCFSWNCAHLPQNVSEQGWGRALPGSQHSRLWLDAPHGNNSSSVRETAGGLDVKHMIKCFVLLSLEYINSSRLQGEWE